MKILVLNGVNLNMLGKRDPDLYGRDSLSDLEKKICAHITVRGASAVCLQSNCEGELVNILQQTDCDGVIFNAGAYSHYSYALRDCIECVSVPVVEVHMTDVAKREQFRHIDVLADVCAARFTGKGLQSYLDAADFLLNKAKK